MEKGWDSGSSNQTINHQRKTDSSQAPAPFSAFFPEEVFKNPEFTKIFKEEVEKTVAEVRAKEREERQQRYTEMRNSWLQRRIEQYAEDLNLNDYQKEEFGKILRENSHKRLEMFSNLRNGKLEWSQMQDERDKIRQGTNDKLQLILYPDQYEQYEKIESEQRMSFRGFGQREQSSEPKEKSTEASE